MINEVASFEEYCGMQVKCELLQVLPTFFLTNSEYFFWTRHNFLYDPEKVP